MVNIFESIIDKFLSLIRFGEIEETREFLGNVKTEKVSNLFYKDMHNEKDAKEIVEHMKNGEVCLVSLKLDVVNRNEVFSYILGAAYAIDKELTEISEEAYIIT